MVANLVAEKKDDVTWSVIAVSLGTRMGPLTLAYRNIGETTIWTVVEVHLGLVAVNMPFIPAAFWKLKNLIQAFRLEPSLNLEHLELGDRSAGTINTSGRK